MAFHPIKIPGEHQKGHRLKVECPDVCEWEWDTRHLLNDVSSEHLVPKTKIYSLQFNRWKDNVSFWITGTVFSQLPQCLWTIQCQFCCLFKTLYTILHYPEINSSIQKNNVFIFHVVQRHVPKRKKKSQLTLFFLFLLWIILLLRLILFNKI